MNQYTLDGVPLRDPQLRWFLDRNTGIRIIPARKKTARVYPNVHGQVYRPGATYDAGAVALSIRVKGKDNTELRKRVEFLVGVISQNHKLLTLTEHYSATESRVAQVTLSGSVEPRYIDPRTAQLSAIFSVPGVFWRSSANITDTTPAITTTLTNHDLTPFNTGNAPISDFMFRIRGGAFSTASIRCPNSGSILHIDTPLTATQTLVIDTVTWRAAIHGNVTDDTWSATTGTNVSRLIRPNRGFGTQLVMEPAPKLSDLSMTYRMGLIGTNVSGSPRVTYRAKLSYL